MALVFAQPSKRTESVWLDMVFYLSGALLFVCLFSYAIFMARSYWYEQHINQRRAQMDEAATPEEQADEKKVLGYQKKIDDVASLINNRTMVSGIFRFIETNTLQNVSFSNVDMAVLSHEIRLAGTAATMEALSLQVQAFEKNTDYIKSITVLDSAAALDGKTTFTMSIVLQQDINAMLSIL